MIVIKTFFAIAFGAFILTAPRPAEANQNLVLTDSVKKILISATPIMDRDVNRETFNGKPVLVVFFASW